MDGFRFSVFGRDRSVNRSGPVRSAPVPLDTGPFVDRSGPFRTARWDLWAKTVHSWFAMSPPRPSALKPADKYAKDLFGSEFIV